jgi:hypothetical protein
LLKECGEKPEAIVPRAWLLAFGRPATDKEKERALTFLRQRTEAAHESGLEGALAELCLALFNTNEFVYVE